MNAQGPWDDRAVEIIDFEEHLRDYFRTLNLEWIERFFTIEPPDRAVLDHPESSILARGGHILFARLDGEVVGTCALLKHDERTFELAKMAVASKVQGRHIGRRLGEAVIQRARSAGAKTLFLETNSNLAPALHLYEQLGFVRTTPPSGHADRYKRADVFMSLTL